MRLALALSVLALSAVPAAGQFDRGQAWPRPTGRDDDNAGKPSRPF